MLIDMGPGANNITVRLNPSNNHNIQVLEDDNTLLAEFPQSEFFDIYAITNSATDTLTIDNSSGDPIPAGGSMLYEGGTGTDTIVGSNNTNDWVFTAADAGILNGDVSFTNVPYVTGGSGADDFIFQPGSDITGKVDGGPGGFDTIDLTQTSQTYPTGLQPGTIHGFQDANGAPSVITGTFDNIDFVRTQGQHLIVTSQPPNGVVGAPFGFVVKVEDVNGLVNPTYNGPLTVTFSNNPGSSTLSGSLTINAVNGVGTFSGLFLDKPANGYALTVKSPVVDAANNTVIDPVTTNNFNIIPNTPTRLVVTTQPPTSTTAGVTFGLTIKAEDDNGFVATTYNGTVNVQIANNPGGSTLSGIVSGIAIVNGVASFSGLSLNKTGTGYTLLLTSTNPLLLRSTTTTAINVVAAKATQLIINPQPPASLAAGSLFGFSLYAEDPFGNVDLTFNQQLAVSLSSSGYSGTLSGTLKVNSVNGIANFSSLLLNRVGSTTLTVDTVGVPSATTSAINVVPGQPTQLAFLTEPPATIPAGATFPLVVQVEDAEGNLATPFNGNVTVSVADSATGELLHGTLTVAAVGGIATYNLFMTRAGTGYAVITSGQGLAPNTSTSFNVTALSITQPGAPGQLVFTTEPLPSVAAGTIMNVVVSAEDTYGNVDPSFNGNVSIVLANNPGGSTLLGTLTQPAVLGQAVFPDLQIPVAANGYTLQAGSGTFSSISSPFNITPAIATRLVITTQPNNATVFQPIAFTVSAEDIYGNVDPTFHGAIRANIGANPGGSTLAGTLSQTASGGVVTFSNLTLNKPGAGYTLTATSSGFLATTKPFTVSSGTATQLAVTVQPPSSATAGNPFTVAISAEDSNGNLDPTFGGTVTLVLATNPGSSTLGGTLTVQAVNGVATFSDLTLNVAAGGYKIQAISGVASTSTTTFSVIPGTATQLVVTGEPPASVTAASGFGLTVKGEDAFGNVDPTFNGNVVLTIGTNPVAGGAGRQHDGDRGQRCRHLLRRHAQQGRLRLYPPGRQRQPDAGLDNSHRRLPRFPRAAGRDYGSAQ